MSRPTRISPNPLAQVLRECMPLPTERAVVSSWIESGRVGRLGEAESFFASVLAIPGAEEALAALDLERTGEQELEVNGEGAFALDVRFVRADEEADRVLQVLLEFRLAVLRQELQLVLEAGPAPVVLKNVSARRLDIADVVPPIKKQTHMSQAAFSTKSSMHSGRVCGNFTTGAVRFISCPWKHGVSYTSRPSLCSCVAGTRSPLASGGGERISTSSGRPSGSRARTPCASAS